MGLVMGVVTGYVVQHWKTRFGRYRHWYFICLIPIFAITALYFYVPEGWNSIFFYVFYFVFGIGIGIQELSKSHFDVEFLDYLEWQTGDRIEAVQGIVPGWINTFCNYVKDVSLPFMLPQ
ncbi:MAG: MFS transporter [Clostridia bacterium]|nr:MFS transporter [Clostridia bacterium]